MAFFLFLLELIPSSILALFPFSFPFPRRDSDPGSLQADSSPPSPLRYAPSFLSREGFFSAFFPRRLASNLSVLTHAIERSRQLEPLEHNNLHAECNPSMSAVATNMCPCGTTIESRSHIVEESGRLESSEKMIAILGDRWWPQTAKQDGDRISKQLSIECMEEA